MEKMRIELTAAGHDVGFLVINKIDAEDTQQKLLNQGSFPMVQDIAGVNVWQLMSGSKDDFYLFGKDGRLAKFLPVSGDLVGTSAGQVWVNWFVFVITDSRFQDTRCPGIKDLRSCHIRSV